MSKPWQVKDLTGQTFGNLTVLGLSHVALRGIWIAACQCSAIIKKESGNLQRIQYCSKSCILNRRAKRSILRKDTKRRLLASHFRTYGYFPDEDIEREPETGDPNS